MVDAKERGSDKAPARENGNRVKYAKANSLRTQQTIAEFGKSARHPLCLAALELWRLDAELSVRTKAVEEAGKFVSDIKQQRGQALALVNHFLKEQGKGVETQQAHTLLRNIDKHLPKAQKSYQGRLNFAQYTKDGDGQPLRDSIAKRRPLFAIGTLRRAGRYSGFESNGEPTPMGRDRTTVIISRLKY